MIKPFISFLAHKPQDTPKYINAEHSTIFRINYSSSFPSLWPPLLALTSNETQKNHHLISNYIYTFLRKVLYCFFLLYKVKLKVITWLVGWGLEKNIKQEELFVFVFNEMK